MILGIAIMNFSHRTRVILDTVFSLLIGLDIICNYYKNNYFYLSCRTFGVPICYKQHISTSPPCYSNQPINNSAIVTIIVFITIFTIIFALLLSLALDVEGKLYVSDQPQNYHSKFQILGMKNPNPTILKTLICFQNVYLGLLI